MTFTAHISERGNRIEIPFPYDAELLEMAKSVPGYSFVKKGRDGEPALRFPLDTQTARLLRETFGRTMRLAPDLRAWGREAISQERNLAALSLADDARLRRLPGALPALYERTRRDGFIVPTYQRADIAFMAAHSCINGNQTGLGKTAEVIGAVFEADLDDGPQLVSAPISSLMDTWVTELEEWQPHPVLSGESVEEREIAIKRAVRLARKHKPFWLVINPGMIRYEKHKDLPMVSVRGKMQYQRMPRYPALFQIGWHSVTSDEYHKTGIANTETLGHQAFLDLAAVRKWLLSATPMGGKPTRLFGALRTIDPDTYTSKWTWFERWLEIEENEYGRSVTKVRPGKQREFAESLQPVLVRRLRRDIMPSDQPEHLDVWCPMTPKQEKQYKVFEATAEIRIEEERLSASGILAEYARLKQFANAECRVESYTKLNKATNEHEVKYRVFPKPNSGKLNYLIDRLDENGVHPYDPEESYDGDRPRALVGSESSRMVEMVAGALNERGIRARAFHGGVTPKNRNAALRAFRRGALQVLVVSTTAGGTSLNLEFVDSVHILDETWNPDDQEQLWGRGDRGSREDALLVYWYRTRRTIQEYIHEVADGKTITNRNILDIRREMQAAGYAGA